MFVDSHVHLCDKALLPHIDEVLERAQKRGLGLILNICTEPHEVEQGIALAARYSWIRTVASTTPHDAATLGEADFTSMEAFARVGHLVAIGETGLDYFHYKESAAIQQKLFVRYLHLARELKLPVVVHCREAFADFFDIVDAEYSSLPGILHCFTGTEQEAHQLIQRGWHLSLSGVVTYKKSEELRRIAAWVPENQLLLETDAPWLAPQSRRGALNEPAFIIEIYDLVAQIRNIKIEELKLIVYNNVIKLID